MTPEEKERLQAAVKEIATLVYNNTPISELETLEGLEKTVRSQWRFFGDHQSLLDWVNSQRLITPLVCLGDGHDGVWKLFTEIGNSSSRLEILDW